MGEIRALSATRQKRAFWVNRAQHTVHRLVTTRDVDSGEDVDKFRSSQAKGPPIEELSTESVDIPVDIVDNFAN